LALSRWDSEGGVGLEPNADTSSSEKQWDTPEMSNSDLVQLRIGVIALEKIVISLLATASDGQRELVRDMASGL